jgi:hypothetical protein
MPNFHTAGSIATVDAENTFAADLCRHAHFRRRAETCLLYMLSKMKIEIFFFSRF